MDNIASKIGRPLVIEFLAGPGAGKSTSALGLAYKLKLAGVNIEYLPEYPKSLTWRGDFHTLSLQPYVTAKQIRNLYDLCRDVNGIKAVITDTSPLLGITYPGFGSDIHFEEWVKSVHAQFDIRTFYLERDDKKHGYNPKGRRQTKEEAVSKDDEVLKMLIEHNIPFEKIRFNGKKSVKKIFKMVMQELRDSGRISPV